MGRVRNMTGGGIQRGMSHLALRRIILLAPLLLPQTVAAQWCPFTGPELAPDGLSWMARLALPTEAGEPLELSGTVYRADRRTPAAGVIVYAYHTDAGGNYPQHGDTSALVRRSSALHGWIRTDAAGRYLFHTIRPGPYPSRREAAHVHLEVLPPGGMPCEIDTVEFTDDPLLTPAARARRDGYGGTGIALPVRGIDGRWRATRDIVLWPDTLTVPLRVEPRESVVQWTGTKLSGRARHSGTIDLQADTLRLGGALLLRGRLHFLVTSIAITDIPRWEPVPRRLLRERLLGPTMFEAERFPLATLDIRHAVRVAPGRLHVTGRLTIRDSTHDIRFQAIVQPPSENSVQLTASFTLDRHRFGLSYRGSALGNDLIDDDIRFDIRLVARDARR